MSQSSGANAQKHGHIPTYQELARDFPQYKLLRNWNPIGQAPAYEEQPATCLDMPAGYVPIPDCPDSRQNRGILQNKN